MPENNDLIKLNLGSGQKRMPGFINVDKFGNPDVLLDLETFPWPWEDNSVSEIQLIHVLEHLGQTTELYLNIIKELYRICAPEATLHIDVPHPRHNFFINDPTHIRAITHDGLNWFSKKFNRQCAEVGFSNTALAIQLDVDFEVIDCTEVLDQNWQKKFINEKASEQDMLEAASKYNNVIAETRLVLKVIK